MSPTLAPELDPICTERYSYPQAWTEIAEREPEQWLEAAMNRVVGLQRLPRNWDSYGSGPASATAAETAVRLLYMAWEFSRIAEAPSIVPMSGEGLQVIWYRHPRQIEVDVHPDGSATVLRLEEDEPVGDDEPLNLRREGVEAVVSWLRSR